MKLFPAPPPPHPATPPALTPLVAVTAFIAALTALLALTGAFAPATAQQPLDEEYTALIREFTTETFFSTPLVDHLPFSETVPTPLDHLGHISGAPDILSYPDEVHGYMRALAAASPRVEVFTIGTSEEGREMILVVISSDETIAALEEKQGRAARLGGTPALQPPSRPPNSSAPPSRPTGPRARSTPPRRGRPRCSWSWPTGSRWARATSSARSATTWST